MVEAIQKYFGVISIGESQTYQNMAIFPLFLEKEIDLNYYTLDEALVEVRVKPSKFN